MQTKSDENQKGQTRREPTQDTKARQHQQPERRRKLFTQETKNREYVLHTKDRNELLKLAIFLIQQRKIIQVGAFGPYLFNRNSAHKVEYWLRWSFG